MDAQTAAQKILQKRHAQKRAHDYSKLNYKQAVLATLAYFDIFNYPLTQKETTRYLFKLTPDAHHVEMTLNESGHIKKRGSYFHLKQSPQNIEMRHSNEIIAKKLWARVEKYRRLFETMPFIQLVSICNNLAINNTNENSDIDLLIITKPNRLFISRLILTFWLHIFGIRRHGKKVAGRFCLSFFITENALDFESIRKEPLDIYLSYWLANLQPITGNRETYHQLLLQNNEWMKHVFATPPHPNLHHFKDTKKWTKALKKIQEKILGGRWGSKIEAKLSKWQIARAKEKKEALGLNENDSAVIINKDMLKFHNVDKREEIHQQWIHTLEKLLKR
jgi:hypothetical protein